MVVLAPILAPYHYAEQHIPDMLQGPSVAYPLGTDHLGRDILSRLIYGSRLALGTALPAISVALVGGVGLGLILATWLSVWTGWVFIAVSLLVGIPSARILLRR